jgi:hypothetical protein
VAWQIYLSGEIHTDWRERIVDGAETAALDVDRFSERGHPRRAGGRDRLPRGLRPWVAQDDPTAFRRLTDQSLEELRSVTAA